MLGCVATYAPLTVRPPRMLAGSGVWSKSGGRWSRDPSPANETATGFGRAATIVHHRSYATMLRLMAGLIAAVAGCANRLLALLVAASFVRFVWLYVLGTPLVGRGRRHRDVWAASASLARFAALTVWAIAGLARDRRAVPDERANEPLPWPRFREQESVERAGKGRENVRLHVGMKTVILAGGLGTRISEETENRPKPMIEIGGKPLLWHLLNLYSAAGFGEFVIAAGYKQEVVKAYFHEFFSFNNDFMIDLATGNIVVHHRKMPDWKVHVMDTGLTTMTGGRLKRLRPLIGEETFMCTYGDGLASIDVADLVRFHRQAGRLATLTAVRPPARFGGLELDGDRVATFVEKPQSSEGWINGGFFVFEPALFDRIAGDETLLEHEPLATLATDGQLSVYRHEGFWQPMDTLRDKRLLEQLWASGNAPWARA